MSNALKIRFYTVKYFMIPKDKKIKKNPYQGFLFKMHAFRIPECKR